MRPDVGLRNYKMRKDLSAGTITVASLLSAGAFVAVSFAKEADAPRTLREELMGTWILEKDLVFDSKSEVEPSLRKLSFGTNDTVTWWYEIGGKPETHSGRYAILSSTATQSPNVTVTEDPKGDAPSSSRSIAFVMKEVTVDLDSRFSAETVGKVLKFDHRDGKKYVFTRQQKQHVSQPPAGGDGKPAPQP
jgi:hypothetical protein